MDEGGDFDRLIREQSATMLKNYRSVLLARFKTEKAAIDGVSKEIKRVVGKYVGQESTAETRELIRSEITRALTAMVTN